MLGAVLHSEMPLWTEVTYEMPRHDYIRNICSRALELHVSVAIYYIKNLRE